MIKFCYNYLGNRKVFCTLTVYECFAFRFATHKRNILCSNYMSSSKYIITSSYCCISLYVSVAALVRIVNICFELHHINELGERDQGNKKNPDGRRTYNTIIYGIWARAQNEKKYIYTCVCTFLLKTE